MARPGKEKNFYMDGKFYPSSVGIESVNLEASKSSLYSSQTDLSEAWEAYRMRHNMWDVKTSFLKHASGECPETVKDMLREIVSKGD